MKLIEHEFEWDLWNAYKNVNKHGVLASEAESVFYDEKKVIFEDLKHVVEKRYIIYGKSTESRVLTLSFTYRNGKIRIISARVASRQERRTYYEVQKT